MKLLWTLVKIVLAVALLGPLAIIVLATTLGILGALVGLAFFALRIAFVAFVIWAVYRLAVAMFGGREQKPVPPAALAPPPPRDRHYEEAMRELDQELGTSR